MRNLLLALLAFVFAPAAPGIAAESIGVANEALVTVKGTVVDVACEVTHDCAPRCGDGRR